MICLRLLDRIFSFSFSCVALRFKHIFLWLKFTTVTPSFYFKNRLFIEKGFRRNNMYTFIGNTHKSFSWLKSSSSNLTLYWFRRRYLKWLRAFVFVLVIFYLYSDFTLIPVLSSWSYFLNGYYLFWRLVDSFFYLFSQLYFTIAAIVTTLISLVFTKLLPAQLLTFFKKESSTPNTDLYSEAPTCPVNLITAFETRSLTDPTFAMHANSLKKLFALNFSLPVRSSISLNNKFMGVEPFFKETKSITPYKDQNCTFFLPSVLKGVVSREVLLNSTVVKGGAITVDTNLTFDNLTSRTEEVIRSTRWVALQLNSPRTLTKHINLLNSSTPSMGFLNTDLIKLTNSTSLEWLAFREYLSNGFVAFTNLPLTYPIQLNSKPIDQFKPYMVNFGWFYAPIKASTNNLNVLSVWPLVTTNTTGYLSNPYLPLETPHNFIIKKQPKRLG